MMAEFCGYCGREEKSWSSILCYKCDDCELYVHYDCIKSKQPSPLLGDAFYKFKCQSCGEEKKEEFHRVNLSWRNAVMLVLYNLHKTGQGKRGFFHWKAHICAFLDMHWLILFGHQRKKTGLWVGTVAGTLSAGCPEVFESGMAVVEQGYWRLISVEPPLMTFEKKSQKPQRKRQLEVSPVEYRLTERSCRRVKANALSAAIELKEKRESLMKNQKKQAKNKKSGQQKKKGDIEKVSRGDKYLQEAVDSTSNSSRSFQEGELSMHESPLSLNQNLRGPSAIRVISPNTVSSSSSSSFSSKKSSEQTEPKGHSSKITFESLGLSLGDGDDDDDDLEIDIDIESVAVNSDHFVDIRSASPEMKTLIPPEDIKWEQESIPEMESLPNDTESEGQSERDIKEEIEENVESEMDDNDGDDTDSADDCDEEQGTSEMTELVREAIGINDGSVEMKKKKQGRPRKRRRLDDPLPDPCPERLERISVFEENELLDRLNVSAQNNTLTPELTILRRKLICNRTNREYGLPVFDLDAQVEKVSECHQTDNTATEADQNFAPFLSKLPTRSAQSKETRDLDRFMMKDSCKRKEMRQYTSFRQRLVGLEDNALKPMISPYTTRVLVPFIWRNKNMIRQPLKMRLLQEIQAYSHRNEPSWNPPPPPSIDYCYVRPEHIASVNALAREFFWPGIDMSECLQYPDFSCVVLYRKIVIAFAFMVPDRGYNEAYISFIFTHPEWRGVGIASFMLYHLIQTCMGKDVLLHVSASNPAMLLYQKFGFKAEELSLNFYHKYFPSNCTDSCHAFLMRLSR